MTGNQSRNSQQPIHGIMLGVGDFSRTCIWRSKTEIQRNVATYRTPSQWMFAGDGGNFRRTASAPIPPPSTFSVSLNLPKLSCVLLASRFLSAAPPFLVVHIFSGQRFADGSGLDEVGVVAPRWCSSFGYSVFSFSIRFCFCPLPLFSQSQLFLFFPFAFFLSTPSLPCYFQPFLLSPISIFLFCP